MIPIRRSAIPLRALLVCGALVVEAQAEAQDRGWSVSTTCTAASPIIEGQPQLVISATTSVDPSATKSANVKFFFSGVPAFSAVSSSNFSNVTLNIEGFRKWEQLTATAATTKGKFVVSVPMADKLSVILPALAKGAQVEAIIPTSNGDKSITVSLKGSGKVIQSLRKCTG